MGNVYCVWVSKHKQNTGQTRDNACLQYGPPVTQYKEAIAC